jgi:hypothetical protein
MDRCCLPRQRPSRRRSEFFVGHRSHCEQDPLTRNESDYGFQSSERLRTLRRGFLADRLGSWLRPAKRVGSRR